MRNTCSAILAALFIAAAAGCASSQALQYEDIGGISDERSAELGRIFPGMLEEYGVITAGVGLIKNGKLIWTGYYGEQSPGVPASRNTQFDVASITKTVTAETILRLVQQQRISLDEPMSDYWIDPDLANDPRHRELTPRMALNHSTGFPNWRFFARDNKLIFESHPGTAYTYSGEGFEYVARYVEQKLGRRFDELVQETVFDPIGITSASFAVQRENFANIAQPVDRDGVFHGHYCYPYRGCRKEGEYSAADDLRITVEEYAKFLIAVMNADGYSETIADDRNRVQTDKSVFPDSVMIVCDQLPEDQCPDAQGYGLGWEVADYGDNLLVGHGGSDLSEIAEAYFYSRSKDGVIVFLNAPNINALKMMPEAIKLLDETSPLPPHYAVWLAEELQDTE